MEAMEEGDVMKTCSEQLQRCKTENAVYATLNTMLRSTQKYGVGETQLYVNLQGASRYIQGMCQGKMQCQDLLRESGVFSSLLEAFLFFYSKHLEDHINPMNNKDLVKCWSNLSSAIVEAVNNPINKLNQDYVIKKLIEKQDLKIIEFVLLSSKSIEKQTELYVIPLVQLFRSLIIDNPQVKKRIVATDFFIPSLADALRTRLKQPHNEALICTSVDLIAWLLSMLLQLDADLSDEENLSGISSGSSWSNIERVLVDLVRPTLFYMEQDRLAENRQSVGVIMMLASMLGRSLDIVSRFLKANGEVTLGQILASDQTKEVTEAVRMTFQVLAVQKKRLRETEFTEDLDKTNENDGISISMTGRPCVITVAKSCSMDENKIHQSESGDYKPNERTQAIPNNHFKGVEHARYWVEMCREIGPLNGLSKISSNSSPRSPSPPPPSESISSISLYKTPSVFSFVAPPRYAADSFCDCHCQDRSRYPKTTSCHHRSQREMSKCRRVPNKENDFEFVPPKNRKRKASPMNSPMDDEDDDRGSMISIKIPRMDHRSKANHGERQEQELSDDKNDIEERFSRMIADLRPCEFVETDDHVVVLCTPSSPQKANKTFPQNSFQETTDSRSHQTKSVVKKKSPSGVFGRFFTWLFK